MADKLYLVIVEDRHVDPEYGLFTMREDAVAFARDEAEALVAQVPRRASLPDVGEEQISGWPFAYRCSGEGDYVHVEEVEVFDGYEKGE